MSDQEILWINQACQGDDQAFGFLVECYHKRIFSLCYRMLANSHDAEDAAQESFIKAYKNIKKYDPNRSFATWLLSIAAHHCIDLLRKRRLPIVSIEELPTEIIPDRKVHAPEQSLHHKEQHQLVNEMVLQLKPLDRAVIVLRYWHQLSEIEIAKTLNLSVSAVKSRLYRSRQILTKSWNTIQQENRSYERRPHESPVL